LADAGVQNREKRGRDSLPLDNEGDRPGSLGADNDLKKKKDGEPICMTLTSASVR